MIKAILDWFAPEQIQQQPQHTLEKATAVLLVEIMRADHHIDEAEEAAFRDIATQHLGLSAAEAQLLLQDARQTSEQANDLFQFTELLHQHLSSEDKFQLLCQLWRLAYVSDGIDRYEEHMIRRIAELLYMPHSEFIRAKIQAREQQ
ncbi:hypothetical protein GCM10011297_12700 [Bacterioplanes sanyensis]|uniref:tellurite resistance TerB family protein n=1 Tax=Bacterioplanes sanyensis TaxID=1249553 RepID=UPI001672843E|nr:TerB family tellurite resistance protein [Bacterioplanes sanyensis]GGY41155.1 hypothetical protein GCM10011297_12700 [Bacterioplanes sanyensis]